MSVPRFSLRQDWLFYLFVVSYTYTLGRMTLALWFGDGVNIFTTYTDATDQAAFILDANKVYWSKSGFLFSTLLLIALNLDVRVAVGAAASFWAASLILMFGASATLLFVLALGVGLIGQQVLRRQLVRGAALIDGEQGTAASPSA